VSRQFWRLDVRHKGKRLSTEQMIFNLTAIVEGQKNAAAAAADDGLRETVGILTSENRRRWAQCRHLLLQGNRGRDLGTRSIRPAQKNQRNQCQPAPSLVR
jgi:hypothetical protein